MNGETGPKSIGGWLLLPISALVFTIGATVYNLYLAGHELSDAELQSIWSNFPKLAVVMSVSLLIGIVLTGLASCCQMSIFAFSPVVPRAMQTFYVFAVTVSLIEPGGFYYAEPGISSEADRSEGLRDPGRTAASAAVRTPYFRVSRRVASTFGEGRNLHQKTPEVFS